MKKFKFAKRNKNKLQKNLGPEKAFRNWNKEKETWLIVIPHDDDAVIGMGLTILAGLEAGVDIHVRVTTDGSMGYCSKEEKRTIANVRHEETKHSFEILGVNPKQVKWLQFKDSCLNTQTGRYFSKEKGKSVIHGADGMQNAFTFCLREVRPTRVFVATIADLHPDHRIVNSELQISLFHASGTIWPELGEPIEVPEVLEFAVYCDFPDKPNIQLKSTKPMLEKKLESISAYVSQTQIQGLIDSTRKNGPEEYLKEIDFEFYDPKAYRNLFH
ncbi:MAG: PIG-L family deacetylase [Planctomycetota bacterium]|nr:MAG: PIG-L family deacetylase [Planctomycetota bacterium]